jgi:hypothetical protein
MPPFAKSGRMTWEEKSEPQYLGVIVRVTASEEVKLTAPCVPNQGRERRADSLERPVPKAASRRSGRSGNRGAYSS